MGALQRGRGSGQLPPSPASGNAQLNQSSSQKQHGKRIKSFPEAQGEQDQLGWDIAISLAAGGSWGRGAEHAREGEGDHPFGSG